MAKEKSVGKDLAPSDIEGSTALRVRRGRVESVDLYEIKDNELELFEKGSPSDLQLNFAIFLVSLAFSAICSLATATFPDLTVKTIFIVVSICGVLLGAYLLISWWRTRTSLKEVCVKIRERIPPESAPIVLPADLRPEELERPVG